MRSVLPLRPRACRRCHPCSRKDILMLRTLRLLLPLLLIGAAGAADAPLLRYNETGALIAPRDYRDWIFLTSGLNMNYGTGAPATGEDDFDNVFVDPVSWRVFKATGSW